jgi:uncharacterized membrane protein YfhO
VTEHEITFRVTAGQPDTGVMIAQTWHQAWRAEVNGKPATVARVNHAFQGLAVPIGESRVRFFYHDAWFIRGTTVSLLTMLILFVARFRRKAVRI